MKVVVLTVDSPEGIATSIHPDEDSAVEAVIGAYGDGGLFSGSDAESRLQDLMDLFGLTVYIDTFDTSWG